LNIIGPGSEWFWAMAQFVVVVVTLVGLYRQLRQSNAANAVQRMEAFQGEWNSPRLIYARLAVAIWRKHTTSAEPSPEAQVPLAWLCGFFENLSDLHLAGYLDWREIEVTWGAQLALWWQALPDTIATARVETLDAYSGFELLAKRALAESAKRGDNWVVTPEQLPAALDVQIRRNRTRLRLLRDLETGAILDDPLVAAG